MEKATEPARGDSFPWLKNLFGSKNEVDPKDVQKATASFAKSKASADPKLGQRKKKSAAEKKRAAAKKKQ
jgi:hypothetical protein